MINKGLVIALLIAVFGLIGFVIWQNLQIEQSLKVANQNSQVSAVPKSVTSEQEDMSAPDGGSIVFYPDEYVLIPELKIGFRKVSGLTVSYSMTKDRIVFAVKELQNLINSDPNLAYCGGTQFLPHVSMSLAKGDTIGGHQISLGDGRYLDVYGHQSICYDMQKTSAASAQELANISELFSSFLKGAQSYFVDNERIREWGLEYKVTNQTKYVYHKIEKSNPDATEVSLNLYSSKLSSYQQLGDYDYYKVVIIRSKTDPRLSNDKAIHPNAVRKIGDYYYWNTFESQSPCPHYDINGKIDQQVDSVCSAEIQAENAVFSALEADPGSRVN